MLAPTPDEFLLFLKQGLKKVRPCFAGHAAAAQPQATGAAPGLEVSQPAGGQALAGQSCGLQPQPRHGQQLCCVVHQCHQSQVCTCTVTAKLLA